MTAPATADAVRAALGRVLDPEIRRPLPDLDMIDGVTVDGSTAIVDLALTIVGCPAADRIERDARAAALSVPGVERVEVRLAVMTPERRAALTERLRGRRRVPFGPDSLTRVLAVTSGKGGVGKSTVTANVAGAPAEPGPGVGVGGGGVRVFSIPGLARVAADVTPTDLDGLILPPVAHGV